MDVLARSIGSLGVLVLAFTMGCRNPAHNHTPVLSSTPAYQYPVATENPSAESRSDVWTCPMHPQVQQSQPGKCPLCGMALVRRGETGAQSGHAHSGASGHAPSSGSGCSHCG